MAKEPPTTAVNRPRKAGTKSRTATRKASAAGKRKAKQAEQSRKDLSSWFYYLAMGVAAVILLHFFTTSLSARMHTAGNLVRV